MDERLKQAMKSYLDNRKKVTSSGDKGQYKFPWRAGRNRFVLLPFVRRVQEADLLRQGRCNMGLSPEDVGKEVPFLVVPRIRYYVGPRGKPTHLVNGLGTPDCPMLQAWLSESGVAKDERKNPEPQDEFVCNVVCMDQPERGVLQYGFKRTEWLGALNTQQNKVTYGVWDLIGGYEPKGGKADLQEGEEAIGGLAPALPVVPPWDEKTRGALVGLKGREIVLVKKPKVIGKAPALVVDDTIQGGPLILGPRVDLPADFYGQGAPKGVKDLLADPASFPGWASNGDHLNEDADVFAAQAVGLKLPTARKTVVTVPELPVQAPSIGIPEEKGVESPVEAPRLPPVEAAAPPLEPRPEPKKPSRPRKRPPTDIQVGQMIHWTEGETTYVGRVYKFFEEAGEEKAEIEVKIEEQHSEKAKADVKQLLDTLGSEAVARVPKAKLVAA